MATPKEDEEQKALVEWLTAKRIMHFAPMNENKGSFANREAFYRIEAKAKKMGKINGVSDIVVFLPNKILFIELKRSKKILKNGSLSKSNSTVSDAQYDFMNKVNKFDYAEATICYGCKEAIEFINNNV